MMDRSLVNLSFCESNISLTAYRSLLMLGILMEQPRSKEELTNIFKYNQVTSKSASFDTIRVTINTLKAAGCVISRPTANNEYKYVLLSHPFRMDISDSQIDCLNIIRGNLVKLGDWQLILDINDFYQKVVSKTQNSSKVELIKNVEPLIEVDKAILKLLSEKSVKNKELIIEYESPTDGLEELKIIADKLFYEDGNLYLWCYSYKYNSNSYLRLDKIKSVKSINVHSEEIEVSSYVAIYKLSGEALVSFKPKQNETILEKNAEYIIIEANVKNEFKFIQRLLSYGYDFELITPDFLKSKLVSKLNSIKQEYGV